MMMMHKRDVLCQWQQFLHTPPPPPSAIAFIFCNFLNL